MRFGALALSSSKANSKERKEGIKKRGVFTVDSENTNTAVISYENPISKTFKKNEIYRSVQFKGYTDSDGYLLQHFGPSQENLVAHYPLGYSHKDESGFGYHGTVGGNPTMGCEGINGVSTCFDGTDDYINLPLDLRDYFHGKSFSISVWFKMTYGGENNENAFFSIKEATATNKYLVIGPRNTTNYKNKIGFSFYNNSLYTRFGLNDNNWNYLVCSYNTTDNDRRIYYNGMLVANDISSSDLDVDAASIIYLGRYSNEYFNGRLQDFRIYNKELTYKEVSELYHLRKSDKYFEPRENSNILRENNKSLPPRKYIKGFWKLNNNLRDLAGGGTNGTFPNGSPDYQDGVFGKCIHFKSASSHYVNIASAVSHIYSVSCFINVKSGTNNPIIYLNSNQYISIDSNKSILFTNNSGNTVQIYINGSLAVTKPGGGNVTNYKSVTNKAVTFRDNDKSITIKEADWTNRPEPDDIIYVENAATSVNNGYKTVDYSTNTKIITDFTFTDGSDDVVDISIGRIDYNKWYHIVVTSESPITTDNPFYIGRQGSNYFDGKIEEVRLYRKLLNYNEVRGLFHQRISGKNLIGHWKLNETNGITAKDSSSYNNHGTMNGPKCGFLAPTGLSRYFDGSNDLIKINSGNNISSKLNESNSITIASWIKPTYPNNTTLHNRTLFSTSIGLIGSDARSELSLHVLDSNSLNRINFKSYKYSLNTHNNLIICNDRSWLHVAATSENGHQSLYINGVKPNLGNSMNINYNFSKPDPSAIGITKYPTQIGHNKAEANDYYMGYLSDLRLYDVALTPPEIRELFYHRNNGLMINGPEDFPIHEKNSAELPDPVVHYRMDERSGGTNAIKDSSGNGNHGTSSGIASSSFLAKGHDGRVGSAISFDGTDDYIQVANDTDLTLNGNLTLSVWFTTDVTSSWNETIISKGIRKEFDLMIFHNTESTSESRFRFHQGNSAENGYVHYDSITQISNGIWYNLIVTREGSGTSWTIKFYLNGRLITTKTSPDYASGGTNTPAKTTNVIRISRRGADYSESAYFDGKLDDVRIYNTALTAEQVRRIYNNSNDLLAHYRISDKKHQIAPDSSINKLDAKYTNFPTNPLMSTALTGSVPLFNGKEQSLKINKEIRGVKGISFWAKPCNVSNLGIMRLNTDQYIKFNNTGSLNIVGVPVTDYSVYLDGALQTNRGYHYYGNSSGSLSVGNWTNSVISITNSKYSLMMKPQASYLGYKSEISTEPVGWWKLNETSGTTIFDSSENKNNGTATNMEAADFTATDRHGIPGGAMEFDGIDDIVSFATFPSAIPTGNSPFTISVWINPDVHDSTNAIVGWGNLSNNQANVIRLNGPSTTGLKHYFYNNDIDIITDSFVGKWTHIAVTFDGTTRTIYVNGVIPSGGSDTPSNVNVAADQFRIGCRPNDNGERFDGKIDDVRIYNTAITVSEVKQLYNLTRSYHGYLEDVRFYGSSLTQAQAISLYKMRGSNAERKEPVGHWTMNEITGDGKLKDISIEANHGTINSGPSFATDRHGNPQGALDFDGTDDIVSFATFPSSIPTGNSPFTSSVWINPDVHDGPYVILGWGNSVSNQSNVIRLNGPHTVGLKHYFYNNDIDIITGSLVGKWTHIAVTFDGTTRTIYVNGAIPSGGSNTPSNVNVAAANLKIGCRPTTEVEKFNGKIDDVRIYNTALSSIEIKNIYNQGRPNTGPIAHWSLDEKRGSLAVDSVNNFAATINGPNLRTTGYDGTINGAMDFDGFNDYLEVKSKINEIQAMSFWMKPDDTTSRGIIQLSQSKYIKLSDKSTLNIVGIPNQYLSLYVDGQTSILNQTNSLSTLNVSQWHHGVISISNDDNSISTEPGYNFIGRVGSSYYDGCLDEIKFFNYPLSLGQAQDLYNDSSAKILDNLGNQNSSFTHVQKDKRGVELGPPEFVPARDSLLVHLKCDETSGTSLKDNATQLLPKDKRTIIKPVGHWTMDESSGTSIADSSGNGNTGTKTADGDLNVTGYNGKKNGAVDFDGSGDYIEIPYSTDLDVSSKNKLTLSVWVKPNVSNWTDDYRCILRYGNPSTLAEETYRLMVAGEGDTSGKFYYYDTPTFNTATSSTILSTSGRWYHIVVVLDGRKIKLYLDGKLNQTVTQNKPISGITSDYKLTIGKSTNSNTDYWKGKIDDVRIYDVALNEKQVMALYKTRNPLGNEVAYYSLDETSGAIVRDSSGNGYHGTSTFFLNSSPLVRGFNRKVGSAIDFDGIDDYIIFDASSSSLPSGNSPFTISVWINPDVHDGNYTVVGWGGQFNGKANIISLGGESGSEDIRHNFWSNNLNIATGSLVGKWTHTAVTFDGTTRTIYLNGVIPSGGSDTPTNVNVLSTQFFPLRIGSRPNDNEERFNGKIDDVRIYDTTLSSDQIRDIYTSKPKISKNITSRDEIEATFRSGDGHQDISSKKALGHEGIENKALHFDGHTNFISLPNEAQQIKSVSLWAKPNKTNNISILQLNEHSFLHMNPNSRLKMFCNKPTSLNLYVNGTLQGHANFSNTVSTSNRALRPYNWSHIVGTWNNAILGSDIRIGEHNNNYFSGYIEDIKLYDCELNKGEVYALSQDRNVGPVINYTLDEGKGNVLYDTGTLGYNANKSGFLSVYDGWDYDVQLQRNVLKFNGSNQYIRIKRNLGEIRTISCWFNTADNLSRNILQLTSSDKLEIDGDKKVSATFASPNTKLYLNSENDTHLSNYNGSTSIKLNTWYFTCVTSSEKIVTNSSLTRIGHDGSSYFSGSLCDIRMYNVELTSKEVKNLYFNSNIYRNTKN